MLLGPGCDAAFGLVEGEDGGRRAGVLGRIRVAEHDFHLAVGFLETLLHLRDLDDLFEHVHRILKVLELFKQRDDVERRGVLGVGECQTVQLIHVAHVLRGLRERDDVTTGGLLAVALLNGAQGTERVEHLARHRLQFATFAVQAMLADVFQSAPMHDGVLTEFHLHHVEAEGLHLPDEVLQRAVSGTQSACLGKRILHDAQIGEEVLGGLVHEVGVAIASGGQTVGDHDHDSAMRFLVGDELGLVGQGLAHFLLVVPQVEQLRACRGRFVLHREVAAHGASGFLKGFEHVVVELARNGAADLGGDVRVAVAVGTNPASRMHKCRADRLGLAGLVTEQPVVEAAIHRGNGVEQRVVEDIDNRVRFLHRGRLLQRDRGRAEQRIDFVVQLAINLVEVAAAQVATHGQQLRNAADLAFDGLAARLGRMGREHGVELKLVEQFESLVVTDFTSQLLESSRQFVDRIGLCPLGDLRLALLQRAHAVVLLAQVDEVEVRGESAGEQFLVAQIGSIDELHCRLKALSRRRIGGNLV